MTTLDRNSGENPYIQKLSDEEDFGNYTMLFDPTVSIFLDGDFKKIFSKSENKSLVLLNTLEYNIYQGQDFILNKEKQPKNENRSPAKKSSILSDDDLSMSINFLTNPNDNKISESMMKTFNQSDLKVVKSLMKNYRSKNSIKVKLNDISFQSYKFHDMIKSKFPK